MLRFATESDIPAIREIYAPYVENTVYSFEYRVPSVEAFTERFREMTAQFPWLVWEENGEILGYAYGSPPFTRDAYAWCAESSIYLKAQAQGRGIGAKLYATLEMCLKLQGYRVLYALITSENTHSLGFHEYCGFVFRADFPRCGYKFQRWVGVVWMEKTLNLVDFPDSAPKPWPEVHTNVQNVRDILLNLSLS